MCCLVIVVFCCLLVVSSSLLFLSSSSLSMSCLVLLCLALSCLVMCHLVVIMPCLILSYFALSFLVLLSLSCLVLSCLALNQTLTVRIQVLRVNDPVRYSSTGSRHATVSLQAYPGNSSRSFDPAQYVVYNLVVVLRMGMSLQYGSNVCLCLHCYCMWYVVHQDSYFVIILQVYYNQ